MENQVSVSAEDLKRELEQTIESWVNKTFNFIQLNLIHSAIRLTSKETLDAE